MKYVVAAVQTAVWALLCLAIVGVEQAHAQAAPSLTFTPSATTGAGSVVPVLTWSTTPVAQSCTASGDWSGTKAASGTETLAAITQSRTYNLTCTWPAGTSATLRWTPPTTNTDGSTLTDLRSYTVHYGTSATALAQTKNVTNASATSDTVTGLAAGTWYFCVRAVNAASVSSDCSNTATKVLSASNVNRSVGIVVNPKPSGPTALTAE